MRHIVVSFLLIFLLFGCGKPVPQEKAAYVGEWQEKNMYLLITQDGAVIYKRLQGKVTTSVNAPIKEFSGNNIEVGIGPLSTIFVVGKPPFQDNGKWKMVVDGVELTRTAQ